MICNSHYSCSDLYLKLVTGTEDADADKMGRSKRKNISPLQKDCGKSRRTVEDAAVSDAEEDGGSQGDQGEDVIADLKEFIRNENARSTRTLAEEIRKFNDIRMTALEDSLSFALTTNETLARRLGDVEEKARQTEKDFGMCVERLAELEGGLDQMQQRSSGSFSVGRQSLA